MIPVAGLQIYNSFSTMQRTNWCAKLQNSPALQDAFNSLVGCVASVALSYLPQIYCREVFCGAIFSGISAYAVKIDLPRNEQISSSLNFHKRFVVLGFLACDVIVNKNWSTPLSYFALFAANVGLINKFIPKKAFEATEKEITFAQQKLMILALGFEFGAITICPLGKGMRLDQIVNQVFLSIVSMATGALIGWAALRDHKENPE